jgi:hypothetical protein
LSHHLVDAVDREGGGVMVDTDTHPSGICGKIIDAIGHRSAELLDQKVVHPDLFRAPLRPILAAIVAEVTDQFFLLGVDRDRWLLFGQSVGSTSAWRSSTNVGSLTVAALRPAPGRRTRAEGCSCANSFKPRPMVLGDARGSRIAVAVDLQEPATTG